MPRRVTARAKARIKKIVAGIAAVEKHCSFAARQRAKYYPDTANPGNRVVVDIDFKQKMVLPLLKKEPSSHFYEKTSYVFLGIGV